MNNKRVYIDFHVVQTVPPSCVNRDDTGSPKTAFYGGAQRARVSSQSWKRAIRKSFADSFSEEDIGVRTKKIVAMVQDCILKFEPSRPIDEARKMSEEILESAGVSLKDGEAKALFFMSGKQAENLAELALDQAVEKKDVKKLAQAALKKNAGVDIALFGRMVADDPSLNTDASCQVAHAISTHRVDNEYDYFTAVDDKALDDNAGAGMIGTVEFNSSTLYRYATVAAHELFMQLDNSREATAKAIKEFARAFITSMPTGKQNTFANRTLPDGVVVTIRSDQPINMVGAFEKPVYAGEEGGYSDRSMLLLAGHMKKVYAEYYGAPRKAWVIGEKLDSLGELVNLPTLLVDLEEELQAAFSEE